MQPTRIEALASQVPTDTDRFAEAMGLAGRSKLFNNQPPASFIFSGPMCTRMSLMHRLPIAQIVSLQTLDYSCGTNGQTSP